MNIIGDVAGQFSALMRLVNKMPKDDLLFVGDLIDRGPKSRQVVEWVKDNAKCLKGNHEHMAVDHALRRHEYDRMCWLNNGGDRTLDSYENHPELLEEHIEWMDKLPLYYEDKEILVTHAPISYEFNNWQDCLENDHRYEYGDYVLWCRKSPRKRDKFQIFGHNSCWGLKWFDDIRITKKKQDGSWAVCLDASSSKKLTGISWQSGEIFQERF